ncbi:winged helix-turn-helix domain-containing protein [Pseudonocardia hydrocarbonoxydans]|uniref:winged helix-turn-helix domain-containing protein n=1 Tax=Pseudonocardia hydrocarbonoxydans TaxID=76726 RepID=UPI0011449732|nr:helix-turn-helix domain-containing protein [Pseudonocardia hydrocarbonoxydans]
MYSELVLGSLTPRDLGLLTHPGPSLMSIVADSLGGRRQGVPPPWVAAVRRSAGRRAPGVLGPLFAPGTVAVPDCLTLSTDMGRIPIDEQLGGLRELPPDMLLEQLHADSGGLPPPGWRPVLAAPRRFLTAYADVLDSAWCAVAPVWRQAGELLDREAARVERCGADLTLVLAGTHTRLRARPGRIGLPDPNPETFDRAGRPVALLPLVSGYGASVFSVDRPDEVWLGYPVPGVRQLFGAPPPPTRHTALDLVLGEVRADVLRRADGVSTGRVAARVGCAVSTLTYHCDHLVAAGLLSRSREGRAVVLRRTERGESLLGLLDVPD